MDSEGCSDYEGDQGQDLVLLRKIFGGSSLVVQWLGLSASITRGMGSIPGWETKIPQPHSKAKNK